MNLLSGLQFIGPWYLAGALLTPLLIYAYLHKTPQHKKIVSSLIVLRTLKRREAPKTKFKPPLRFFLELIALLSLCLAAAMPVQTDSRRRVALVVDNSLSMRTLDNPVRTPGTRLERAKELARKYLGEQRGSTTVDLFASSPRLTRVGAESQPLAAAEQSLDEIKPASAPDNLEAAIDELGESGTYERVVAVSDKAIEYREGLDEDGTLLSSESAEKKYTRTIGITAGERAANIFVSGFSVVQGPLGEGEAKLVASIGVSAPGAQSVRVIFTEIAAAEEVLESKAVNVSPGRSEEVSTVLSQGLRPRAIYRVQVYSADERPPAQSNALVEDDKAWLAPQAGGSEKILVVSPGGGATGLDSLNAFSVESILPEAFAARAAEGLEKYSLVIFHRAAPSVVPQRATLLILPPPENPLFPVAEDVRGASVSSWMSEHPITSYLKVQLLNLSAAEIFAVPPWAESVVRAEQGPVVAAGESHGVRFAAVGIELLPFEGGRTPVLSVLTLNLLNWLTGGSELTGSTLAGTTIRLDPKETWRVREPSGKEETVSGENAKLTFLEPGPYRVRGAGEEKFLAANAFFPDESATFSATSYSARRVFVHEKKIEEGSEPWWPYLLAFALSVLLLEQLLFMFPERRKA